MPYKIVVVGTFFDTFGVADLQANRAPHPPHGGPPSPLGKVGGRAILIAYFCAYLSRFYTDKQ